MYECFLDRYRGSWLVGLAPVRTSASAVDVPRRIPLHRARGESWLAFARGPRASWVVKWLESLALGLPVVCTCKHDCVVWC